MFVLASGVVGENNEIYCIVLCILEILFFGCKSLRNQSIKHGATIEINIRRIFGGGGNISFIVLLKCT